MVLPTDTEVAERLRGHFQANSTDTAPQGDLRIPVSHYFDEDHAAVERAHLLEQPIVVAHGSLLPAPGSFVTSEVLGVPLLIVRQQDATVRAFRNICRHRGGRVEPEESGSKRVFTCRYHGWTYNGDGGLRNIPYEEFFASVDKTCNGLVPVAVEERHGLVWAVLGAEDAAAVDIADHLGPVFDAQFAALKLDEWTVYIDAAFELDVNWKLVVEGAIDVLHLKFLHPETVGRLIQTNTHVWDTDGNHGRLSMARRTMEKLADDVPEGTDLRSYVVQSYFIYPNSMLNVQPRSYELWTVLPDTDSAEASRISIRVLVPPTMTDEERATVDKSWQVVVDAAQNDDWPMELGIQQGVKHAGNESFICGANEVPVQHFHRRLADHLVPLPSRRSSS